MFGWQSPIDALIFPAFERLFFVTMDLDKTGATARFPREDTMKTYQFHVWLTRPRLPKFPKLRKSGGYSWLILLALLAACVVPIGGGTTPTAPTATSAPTFTPVPSIATLLPTALPTATPLPTETPILTPTVLFIEAPTTTNTPASIAEHNSLPACVIIDDAGKLYVLSDDVIFAWGSSKEDLNQALASIFPKWADFRQEVSWTPKRVTAGKVMVEASFQEQFALNPAVTLVTVGVSLNWKLPSDGNLYWPARNTGKRLVRLWYEYNHPENDAIRAYYPEVANAATYALYVFFGYDEEKLQTWCDTYQTLFRASPLHSQ